MSDETMQAQIDALRREVDELHAKWKAAQERERQKVAKIKAMLKGAST